MNVNLKSRSDTKQEFAPRTASLDELIYGTSLFSGKYIIDKFISLNNLGIKYSAHTSEAKNCIIKELFISDICRREGNDIIHTSPEDTKEFRSLIMAFKKDLENLVELDNPNIGNILEFFEENNTIYVAIEEPKGLTLHDRLSETQNSLSPDQITEILRKLLKALNLIHSLGVLHRDIEPKNITISPDNEPILFIDFSTFRNDTSKETRTVSKIVSSDNPFTSLEMNVSPEDQSPASDIYSLAASFYFAIKGTPPHSIMQRISLVATGESDPYIPLAGTVDGYALGVLETIDMSLNVFSESRISSTIEWLMHLSHLSKDSDNQNYSPLITPPKETPSNIRFPKQTMLFSVVILGACMVLSSLTQYLIG